jgi:hypothetical protein
MAAGPGVVPLRAHARPVGHPYEWLWRILRCPSLACPIPFPVVKSRRSCRQDRSRESDHLGRTSHPRPMTSHLSRSPSNLVSAPRTCRGRRRTREYASERGAGGIRGASHSGGHRVRLGTIRTCGDPGRTACYGDRPTASRRGRGRLRSPGHGRAHGPLPRAGRGRHRSVCMTVAPMRKAQDKAQPGADRGRSSPLSCNQITKAWSGSRSWKAGHSRTGTSTRQRFFHPRTAAGRCDTHTSGMAGSAL